VEAKTETGHGPALGSCLEVYPEERSMKPDKEQQRPMKLKDATYEDYIEELIIIRDSMNLARQSIDLMGMDPEMFTHTKDLASAQFKELVSSIREGRKRDATLAAVYIKELLYLIIYGAEHYMERPDEHITEQA
jgi:hypothetical protein